MKLIETGSFPIADIQIGKRLRTVDEAWAQGLAEMIGQSPLQNPIQVMKIGNGFRLVAGRHRMRAYEILGRTDIPAAVYEPSTDQPELELRLAEIDENLGRNELNVLDRAAAISERQTVLRALHGETRGRPTKKTANFAGISIAAEIAGKMNLSKRTIEAAVSMFNGLSADTRKRVDGTWLADNHVQLRQLALLDAGQQSKALDLILADEPKAKRVADAVCIIEKRPKPTTDHSKTGARLQKLWLAAPRKVQREFLEFLRLQGHIGPSAE